MPMPAVCVFAGRKSRDPALAKRFAQAVYCAHWGEGRDMSMPGALTAEGAALGIGRAAPIAATRDQSVKQSLRDQVDASIAKGAFGRPTFIVDGVHRLGAQPRVGQVDPARGQFAGWHRRRRDRMTFGCHRRPQDSPVPGTLGAGSHSVKAGRFERQGQFGRSHACVCNAAIMPPIMRFVIAWPKRNLKVTGFMRRQLLGYDLRLAAVDYLAARWTPEYRATFLLRPDVAWPLSVDPSVWPSAFRYDGDSSLRRYFPGIPAIEAAPVNFQHDCLELWPDPAAMRAATAASGLRTVEVAIELLADDETLERARQTYLCGATLDGEISAAPLPADWRLLGYDIADAAMTSGLVNCGYFEGERVALRACWGPRLDDHGLVRTLDDAIAFRFDADVRVPEHAPFLVFALHVGGGLA